MLLQPMAKILLLSMALLRDLSHMTHWAAEANWSHPVSQSLSVTIEHDYLLNLNPEG